MTTENKAPFVYYASSISQTYEHEYSKHIRQGLDNLGFRSYLASLNDSINDKRNDPTPSDIYHQDVTNIENCDIFLLNLTGSRQEGTIFEIGVVSGLNSIRRQLNIKEIEIVAFTTNTRLLHPQLHDMSDSGTLIASACANHLVLGAIEENGIFVGDEESMWSYMRTLVNTNE